MPIGSRAGWVRPFEKPWFVRVQLNFLGVDFPALPFRAEHLAQAVTTLAQLADGVLRDLRPGEEPARVAS